MAASRCIDTFVIMIIADADCHLAITEGSELVFDLEPGNERGFTVSFEYRMGVGFNTSHAQYGFSFSLDDLNGLDPGGNPANNTGNARSMSFGTGTFNPPSPDTTQGPRALLMGSLSFSAAAAGNIDAAARDQNVGGEVVLNTGVNYP